MNTSIVFHEISHYSETHGRRPVISHRRTHRSAAASLLVHQVVRHGRHRDAAQQALADAQRNPVLSADQLFASAQVHVLLAIEARIGELVDADHS